MDDELSPGATEGTPDDEQPDEATAAIIAQGAVEVGYVKDFISGVQVRAMPEEIEAVQVMARRLVEEYGYPLDHVQTRPQFHVRKSPGGKTKAYPVDIAVFSGSAHREDSVHIIVECKRRVRKDGITQLRLYMDMSPACEIGVWFNGEDHEYIRKVFGSDGTRSYTTLPNIPRFGQRIEDVGMYTRKELVKPTNLKAVFRDLRNHLAGNMTGITRDEALAQEIVNLLFCKIYDEINTGADDVVTFRCGQSESAEAVAERILTLFEDVKTEYSDVFSEADAITLDRPSISYVVGELQTYCVTDTDRDAIGEAFEVFIGPALRGAEGQFFTPRNVVRLLVEMLDPEPGEMIIDPACGSGGFLIVALEHVWSKLEKQAVAKGWSDVQLDRKKREVASKTFRGIDKDSFLAKVTKAYMAIIGDGRGGVFCVNSLQPPTEWDSLAKAKVKLGTFNVVMTNPPFGKRIKITGASILEQYDLGHKWKRNADTGDMEQSGTLQWDQSPQLLFLERCLQLLGTGGRLGIVLPESILGNPSYEHILQWLHDHATVRAVVTMPEALFKTSGKGGTHAKVCVLFAEKRVEPPGSEIFLADAKWCGHDSRGNATVRVYADRSTELLDDVPTVSDRFDAYRKGTLGEQDHLGYVLNASQLRNHILVPKYYDPELAHDLDALCATHDLPTLGDLRDEGVVSISTGIEVGKMVYGTGPIPFIRTSDISNWELKSDPKHGVSEQLFAALKDKCDVREGDILVVRDGTYLIGVSAMVTEHDLPMLYQSHIYKIRVTKPNVISPWLLFASLNAPIVKRQIRSKQFTQDIIDTLGNRLMELQLPVPKNRARRAQIATVTERTITTRAVLRSEADQIAVGIEGAGDR
ncbi:MAG: N-6 DNA methylase [Acidimicrobiales bacterium]